MLSTIKFKKIILTTDLSENADAATPYAAELAQRFQGRITLVHVQENTIYFSDTLPGPSMSMNVADWVSAVKLDREQRLSAMAKSIREESNVEVVHMLGEGQPANTIVTFAKAETSDCIVMSTHGRTGLSRWAFGSVAERVVRLSPCPVLTVRPSNIVVEKIDKSSVRDKQPLRQA